LPFLLATKLPIWVISSFYEIKVKKGQIVLIGNISTAQIEIGGDKVYGIQLFRNSIIISD
jgi:hypothetical protein